jgi:hypothetical protein
LQPARLRQTHFRLGFKHPWLCDQLFLVWVPTFWIELNSIVSDQAAWSQSHAFLVLHAAAAGYDRTRVLNVFCRLSWGATFDIPVFNIPVTSIGNLRQIILFDGSDFDSWMSDDILDFGASLIQDCIDINCDLQKSTVVKAVAFYQTIANSRTSHCFAKGFVSFEDGGGKMIYCVVNMNGNHWVPFGFNLNDCTFVKRPGCNLGYTLVV